MKKAGTIVGLFSSAFLAYATVSTPSLGPNDPPAPTRQLTWGDVNVLHTTDIHGWVLGHSKKVYPERSWSGTFGDLYSFVHHMRAKAKDEKKDLLLVDTGDRRTGSGLTDRNNTGVNGQAVSELYLKLGYDALVPGNHDLKNDTFVKYTIDRLAALWEGRYLTSNVELAPGSSIEHNGREHLGAPYRNWTTENQKKVMAFGVVPGGKDYSSQIKVIKTTEMVKKAWFQSALNSSVDLFLILGHVDPINPDSVGNTTLIYEVIRKQHPLTPIMVFGGHTHKRNCMRLPNDHGSWRSMFLQSGNYFNTVGWMSAELDDNSSERNLTMTRRYLDNNVPTYMFHTGKTESDFHTDEGRLITDSIYRIERAAGLSQVYGYLESDYFMDRETWSDQKKVPNGLFDFYLDAVEEILIDKNKDQHWMFFSNWGIVRGDIYAGPFTLGDMYAVSPDDPSPYLSVEVHRSVADEIVEKIHEIKSRPKATTHETKPFYSRITKQVPSNDDTQIRFSLTEETNPNNLTYGLVTTDRCGEGSNLNETVVGEGDDVKHFKIPQVVLDGSDGTPEVYFWRKSWGNHDIAANASVKLIFTNYIGNKTVPGALKELTGSVFHPEEYRSDVAKQDSLLGLYVRKKFNKITGNIPFPK